MRNLVLKDFALLRSSRLYVIGMLYTLFILFDRGGSNSFFGTSTFFLVFITYMFVNYLNSYDYTYKGDRFINAFPVSRREVVESRYVSVLILAVVFLVAAYGLRSIFWIFGYPYANGIVEIPQLTIVIFAVALYYGIMLPLYFKLGYEKMRWLNFIALIVVSSVSSVLSVILAAVPLFQSGWMIFISAAVSAAILFGSVQIAVNFYTKRDF